MQRKCLMVEKFVIEGRLWREQTFSLNQIYTRFPQKRQKLDIFDLCGNHLRSIPLKPENMPA